jgi:hypothetical protein
LQLNPDNYLTFKVRCIRKATDAQIAYVVGDGRAWATSLADSMQALQEDDPLAYHLASSYSQMQADGQSPWWCRAGFWKDGDGRFRFGPDQRMQQVIEGISVADAWAKREFGQTLAEMTRDKLQQKILGEILRDSRRDKDWISRIKRDLPEEFRSVSQYLP